MKNTESIKRLRVMSDMLRAEGQEMRAEVLSEIADSLEQHEYAMVYQEHFIPLTNSRGTLKIAQEIACEELWDLGADGFSTFEIIEIAERKRHEVSDFDDWFANKAAELDKQRQQQKERLEREQFERLKKKFEKCTCSEKQVDKTNCPLHREFG